MQQKYVICPEVTKTHLTTKHTFLKHLLNEYSTPALFFHINLYESVFKVFQLYFISAQNTGRIHTSSGGTIKLTRSLETKSSSQKRKRKGRPTEPKVFRHY